MISIKTIRGLLLIAAVVFSTALVAVTHYAVSGVVERAVREEAMHDADTFAEMTSQSMFEVMVACAPVVPVAIIAALLMVMYIRRRIERAIRGFANDIRSVNGLPVKQVAAKDRFVPHRFSLPVGIT